MTLLTIICIVALVVLPIAIMIQLANRKMYFFKPEQGTISFIDVGDRVELMLPNIGGYKVSDIDDLNGRHWIVPARDDDDREDSFFKYAGRAEGFQKLLWSTFGIRFIGWTWPNKQVHEFSLSRLHLREGADAPKNAPLRELVVESPHAGEEVSSLLFIAPRPMYIEGVELAGDNSKINLLLLPVFQQVIPTLPVYYLKGDFYRHLDSAMKAALVDFFATHRVAAYTGPENRKGQFAHDFYVPPSGRGKKGYEDTYEAHPLTYSLWLKLTKAGEKSPLEQHLRGLNANQAFMDLLVARGKDELAEHLLTLTYGTLKKKTLADAERDIALSGATPGGIIYRFGLALVSFRLVAWEPHEETKDLAIALRAKETEFHTAEGARQKAAGVRDTLKLKAEGESQRFTQLVTSLTLNGVNPETAASVVREMLRTENVRDSKLTTWVEGGGNASVMIPTSPPKPSDTEGN